MIFLYHHLLNVQSRLCSMILYSYSFTIISFLWNIQTLSPSDIPHQWPGLSLPAGPGRLVLPWPRPEEILQRAAILRWGWAKNIYIIIHNIYFKKFSIFVVFSAFRKDTFKKFSMLHSPPVLQLVWVRGVRRLVRNQKIFAVVCTARGGAGRARAGSPAAARSVSDPPPARPAPGSRQGF